MLNVCTHKGDITFGKWEGVGEFVAKNYAQIQKTPLKSVYPHMMV